MYVSKHQLLIIIDMLTYVKKKKNFDFICLWLSFSLSSQAQLLILASSPPTPQP